MEDAQGNFERSQGKREVIDKSKSLSNKKLVSSVQNGATYA